MEGEVHERGREGEGEERELRVYFYNQSAARVGVGLMGHLV